MAEEKYEPRSYWDAVADAIDRRGGVVAGDDTPFYRYKREKFLRRFLASMSIEGKTVLEFGCGPGGNLAELMKKQPRLLVGCDISPSMVRVARRTGTDIVELDGSGLPFRDGEFDCVFTVTVLQHNPGLEELIGEICRVSGQAVYLFEDVGPPRAADSYFRRPVEQYSGACRACGFDLISADVLGTRVSGRLHYALGRMLDRRERHEGEPVAATLRALERLLLPVTSRMDDHSNKKVGLTRMVFRRLEG